MEQHQQIFFVLGLLVAVPVLVYYYRRAGHRRFRPRIGEMAMVCLFAVILCGGGAMLMGSFLDDPDQYKVQGDLSSAPGVGAAGAGAGGAETDDGDSKADRRTSRERAGSDRGSRNERDNGDRRESSRRK